MSRRLQVDLSDDDYKKLKEVTRGRSIADVVRRALGTEVYVSNYLSEHQGGKLILEDDEGDRKELVRI